MLIKAHFHAMCFLFCFFGLVLGCSIGLFSKNIVKSPLSNFHSFSQSILNFGETKNGKIKF